MFSITHCSVVIKRGSCGTLNETPPISLGHLVLCSQSVTVGGGLGGVLLQRKYVTGVSLGVGFVISKPFRASLSYSASYLQLKMEGSQLFLPSGLRSTISD